MKKAKIKKATTLSGVEMVDATYLPIHLSVSGEWLRCVVSLYGTEVEAAADGSSLRQVSFQFSTNSKPDVTALMAGLKNSAAFTAEEKIAGLIATIYELAFAAAVADESSEVYGGTVTEEA